MSPAGALVAIHLAVALFGAAGLFARFVAWPAPALVFARVSVAGAGLALVLVALEPGRFESLLRPERAPGGADLARLPLLGALLAVHWVTFFHAIQVSSVAVGLLAFASFPVFTALIEPLLPGESLDRTSLGAAALVALGIALLVPAADPRHPMVQGVLWGLVSGFTFALLSLGNRSLVPRWGALRLALHQNAWAALVLAPFVVSRLPHPTPTEWMAVLLLGLIFTAGAHALFITGLRTVQASRAAVIATLEPVYGIVWAALLLGERPTARVLAGGMLVIGAALWTTRRAARAPRPTEVGARP